MHQERERLLGFAGDREIEPALREHEGIIGRYLRAADQDAGMGRAALHLARQVQAALDVPEVEREAQVGRLVAGDFGRRAARLPAHRSARDRAPRSAASCRGRARAPRRRARRPRAGTFPVAASAAGGGTGSWTRRSIESTLHRRGQPARQLDQLRDHAAGAVGRGAARGLCAEAQQRFVRCAGPCLEPSRDDQAEIERLAGAQLLRGQLVAREAAPAALEIIGAKKSGPARAGRLDRIGAEQRRVGEAEVVGGVGRQRPAGRDDGLEALAASAAPPGATARARPAPRARAGAR